MADLVLPEPGDIDAREQALAERGPEPTRLRRIVDDATATPVSVVYSLGLEWPVRGGISLRSTWTTPWRRRSARVWRT